MIKPWVNRCFLVIVVFVLQACATKGIDPTQSGGLTISTVDSKDVSVSNVYVRQFENEILIHADARPTEPVRFFHPGHLSFELFTADGHQFFNLDVTRYTRKHSDGHRSKMKHVSFWVRMPIDLPNGARLTVSHHEKSVHEKK